LEAGFLAAGERGEVDVFFAVLFAVLFGLLFALTFEPVFVGLLDVFLLVFTGAEPWGSSAWGNCAK
jgi:hypothetical protein